MVDKVQEWLKQADYDIETAEFMFNGGRYFYAVFMCHLSVEKALKWLYVRKKLQTPSKVHNLVYFLDKIGLKPPEYIGRFIVKLNEASVVTRYPEDLEKITKDYTMVVVQDIITNTKEALKWIKAQS